MAGLCHTGCDMTTYMQLFCTGACVSVFSFLFFFPFSVCVFRVLWIFVVWFKQIRKELPVRWSRQRRLRCAPASCTAELAAAPDAVPSPGESCTPAPRRTRLPTTASLGGDLTPVRPLPTSNDCRMAVESKWIATVTTACPFLQHLGPGY